MILHSYVKLPERHWEKVLTVCHATNGARGSCDMDRAKVEVISFPKLVDGTLKANIGKLTARCGSHGPVIDDS